MTAKVHSPGWVSICPSAMWRGTGIWIRSPAASERLVTADARASTPTTRASGCSALRTVAAPAISPPPPIGATSRSSGPASSRSSSAAVPAPAAMRGSS